MKKIKLDNNVIRNIITIITGILIVIIGVAICKKIIKKKITRQIITEQSVETQEIQWITDEEGYVVDLKEIIQGNINNQVKEVIETQVVELEYETEYIDNSSLPKGIVQVLQQGQDGKQELIIRKQYEGELLVADEQIGRKIVTPSIDRIVEVGTSSYYDKHTIKVGETVYATPYELDIKEKNKKDSDVIIKINQDSKLVVENKKGNWYYVKYDTYYGWVESDCVTYIVPNNITYNNENIEYSKKQLLSKLNKNMKLNEPSGLTLEQYEKIFANENKDKNGIFKENAKYFYYIEQSYGVNGVFVAAIGIHESAWGTSKIATDKKNLFGYGAYDMNAYASAYKYNGYAAGIDMVSRVLVKHYLNHKGTNIYNGEVATGKFYNGSNLAGVNKKYATDKNWANAVYKWMEYLYNRL